MDYVVLKALARRLDWREIRCPSCAGRGTVGAKECANCGATGRLWQDARAAATLADTGLQRLRGHQRPGQHQA